MGIGNWALGKQGKRYLLFLTTANCQLSTANCQLPTANCQLPTANCQLSTVNCQLPTDFIFPTTR
ncbi:MAG: hypothetical protein EAZ39_03745 [Oscillatoriales cyanobacterium]|nr:MAG: hypothetical protein EAZ39_03745 [Oscillatoriales cyanobacterium]